MEAEVIPVLRVADAAVAVAWYERLGFTNQWEHRFGPGMPAFVSIARDEARLFLSEHRAVMPVRGREPQLCWENTSQTMRINVHRAWCKLLRSAGLPIRVDQGRYGE